MKFQNQTVFSDPENGVVGNCFSACLSSLFDVDIESAPVFKKLQDWYLPYCAFLNSLGYESDGCFYFNNFSTTSKPCTYVG